MVNAAVGTEQVLATPLLPSGSPATSSAPMNAAQLAAAGQNYAAGFNRSLSFQSSLYLGGQSNGTNTWANSMYRFPVLAAAPGFAVRYANTVVGTANDGERSSTQATNQISIKACALKLYGKYTATASSATSLTIGAGTFNTDELRDKLLVVVTGTNNNQSQIITSNTATVLNVASWLGGTPGTTVTVNVYDWFPVFFNGSKTCVADPDALIESDFIPMQVNVGDNIWIITNVSCSSGIWPVGNMPGNFNASGVDMWNNTGTGANIDATNPVATNAWSTVANNAALVPLAIVGRPYFGQKPSVTCVGDSLWQGTGSSNDANVGFSLPERLCVSLGCPSFRGGIPGETTLVASGPMRSRIRRWMAAGSQYVYIDEGVNDSNVGLSLATTKAAYLALWASFAAEGCKVVQRIPTPAGVTSTDGWTTLVNQTANPNFAAWLAINQWLRDASGSGAMAQANGSLYYIFDPSPAIETSQDSGFWASGSIVGVSQTVQSAGNNFIIVAGTPYSSAPYTAIVSNPSFYQVKLTSGSGVNASGLTGGGGRNVGIANILTGNRINFNSGWTSTPQAGDTFEFWPFVTADGTHPVLAAIANEIASFPTNLFV